MADEKGYNGWSNYETWNVKLWIDNEEGSYNYWREQTREAWKQADRDRAYPSQTRAERTASLLADMLKAEHEENTPTVTGIYADLLNAALSDVDWYEIAEAMISDEEFEDEESTESEKESE